MGRERAAASAATMSGKVESDGNVDEEKTEGRDGPARQRDTRGTIACGEMALEGRSRSNYGNAILSLATPLINRQC